MDTVYTLYVSLLSAINDNYYYYYYYSRSTQSTWLPLTGPSVEPPGLRTLCPCSNSTEPPIRNWVILRR